MARRCNCVPSESGRPQTVKRALWHAVALLAVLLLALPEVARAAHLVFVAHVACPYDGVMVHADELPVAAREAASREGSTGAQRVSVAPEHQHHGCSALTFTDRPCAFALTTELSLSSVLFALTPPEAERAEPSPRPVLSYAPKLPPPPSQQP